MNVKWIIDPGIQMAIAKVAVQLTWDSCLIYALVAVLMCSLFCYIAEVPPSRAQGSTSISVVPSPVIVDATQKELFNVSVWVYDVTGLYAYQLALQVNDSAVSISRGWVPRLNSSWVFSGKTFIGTEPAFLDQDRDGLNEWALIGDSVIYEEDLFTGNGLLAIIELHVEHSPATTVLNIDPLGIPPWDWSTHLYDYNVDDISATKNNGQVQITGEAVEKYPSQLTLSASPPEAILGETVVLAGNLSGIKEADVQPIPNGVVTLQRISGAVWIDIDNDETNETGHYRYAWLTDVTGAVQVRSKWDGDETFKGALSNTVTVNITEVVTSLEIVFADPDRRKLGEAAKPLPTVPGTFNVTVMNVTDLYMWKTKIYFDPFILSFGGAWLPVDNVFSPNYTASTVETGSDAYGSYVIMSANKTDGEGFTGDGTLFQMNFTGLRPTAGLPPNYLTFSTDYGDRLYTYLRNSTGYEIPFTAKERSVSVEGELYTEISVVNPETGDPFFNFNVEDFPIGSKFNATIVIRSVLNMSGWVVKLSFNSTLLSPVKVFHPTGNVDYVFYGLPSINDTVIEEGYLLLQDILPPGETPVNVGTDQKLLTVVQFEIVYAPPTPENASDVERVTTILDIAHGETLYLSEGNWLPADTVYGIYSYGYSVTPSDGDVDGGSILDYWPYFLIVIAATVIVATVLMRRRGHEVYEEEYLDEKYLEEEYLE